MHELIERVLTYNNHRDSDAEKSISVTRLIGPAWKSKLELRELQIFEKIHQPRQDPQDFIQKQ